MSSTESVPPAASAEPQILLGACYVSYAYDAALGIDLNDAARRIAGGQRDRLKHLRRAPQSFQFEPLPLRLAQTVAPIQVGSFAASAVAEVVLYDFGAVNVTYQFPLRGPLGRLVELSDALYDNAALASDSRARVEALLRAIGPAARRPGLSAVVEDYAIYCVDRLSQHDVHEVLRSQRGLLARILRAEAGQLAEGEVEEALGCRFAYGQEELVLIDWNAAILLGPDEDVRAVLEFANIELLEMRYLDADLDRALDESYAILTRHERPRMFALRAVDQDLRRIARLQAEGAMLFEGVDNALKLVGDQYLARVYRGASDRMRLPEWNAGILRKLGSLESIYSKLSDEIARRRMELLEWIIILLILVSIVIPFLPWYGGH